MLEEKSRINSVNLEKFQMRRPKASCDGINKWEPRKVSQQMQILPEKCGQKGNAKN